MKLSSPVEPPAADAARALQRACDHLLSLQHPDGWWKAALENTVTMDAADLILRHFLGISDPLRPEVADAVAVAVGGRNGLRDLYVALTRPTQRLTVVHSDPLPSALQTLT